MFSTDHPPDLYRLVGVRGVLAAFVPSLFRDAPCKDAGILYGRCGDKRAPYSLRHTYATFALLYGRVSVYTLAVNMGTSVDMIEKHYGHVKPLQADMELKARYKI